MINKITSFISELRLQYSCFKLQINIIFAFLHDLNLHLRNFVRPAFFSILSSVFEGLTFALLMPLMQGLFQGNFTSFRSALQKRISFVPWNTFFPDNFRFFIFLLSIVAVAVVLKNTFSYLAFVGTSLNVRKFCNALRKRIYERYLSFGKLFFDKTNPGALQQVLIGQTSLIAGELTQFQSIFTTIFNGIIYLIIMFYISIKLTLGIFLLFPLLYFSLKALIHHIRHGSQEYAKYYTNLGRKISNALQCVPLIKACSSEQKEKEWFDYSSDRVQEYEYAIDAKRSLITPLQETIMLLSILLVLAIVSSFIFSGKTSFKATNIIIFFLVLRRAMNAFGAFNQIQTSLSAISGSIGQVRSVLDDHGKYFIKDGSKLFTGHQQNIVFENVSFQYPSDEKRKIVLENIDLTVGKGEMLAVVGGSGSGKSTLISLLMRFYDPTSGRILLDGTDIREYTLESLHEHMALVSQETYLFNAPLRVNLAYGLKVQPSTDEMMHALQQARLENFIKTLPQGLETEIGDRGVNLSGGERQRLAIARALLRKSEILILDEATSALDSTTESMIQSSLQELIIGRTSIVVAHRLSTIRHANLIIVLEQGKIVEQGNVDQLLQQKGKFFEYWEKQRFF